MSDPHPVPEQVEFSIIIPAWNEQQLLPDTLAHAHSAMSEVDFGSEVIVVDNNSNDATAEVARERGARVVFDPINQISRARNAGAENAHGRYLVFVDADTRLSGALLNQALQLLDAGKTVGGGCTVAAERKVSSFERWALNTWNRIGVRFGLAAGCFVFCTREGFNAVGGFSEKVYASEEVWFSRALRKHGKPAGQHFHIIPSPPIVTSMRKTQWYAPWQLAAQGLLALVPFSMMSKTLCAFWYRRPESKNLNESD